MSATVANDVVMSMAARGVGHGYCWAPPRTRDQTGLNEALIDSLICNELSSTRNASGRTIADGIALPFNVLEDRLQKLRTRQLLTHRGAAPLNDYVYSLTELGREYTLRLTEA